MNAYCAGVHIPYVRRAYREPYISEARLIRVLCSSHSCKSRDLICLAYEAALGQIRLSRSRNGAF
jgi:hypothetical protein